MYELKKPFEKSWKMLKTDYAITVPLAVSYLVGFLMIMLFVGASGIGAFIGDYGKLSNEYYAGVRSSGAPDAFMTYLGKYSSNIQAKNAGFDAFLTEKGFSFTTYADNIFTVENGLLLAILVVLSVTKSIIFSNISYTLVKSKTQGKRLAFSAGARKSVDTLLRFIGLSLMLSLILLIPWFIGAVGLLAMALMLHAMGISGLGILLIAVLIGFPLMLLLIVISFVLRAKLLFSLPMLYQEGFSVGKALTASWGFSKGRMKDLIILVLILSGVATLSSQMLARPLFSGIGAFFQGGILAMVFVPVLLVVLVVLHSAVETFVRLLMFTAYQEMKHR